nr:hypothetical protein HmN_000887300 [Hymenolepis microstoma]
METLRGIPDFQLNFDRISHYFQHARCLLAAEAQKAKPNKEKPVEQVTEASMASTCVCLNRKIYFPYERIAVYKRLLSRITTESESGNPEELPEFQEFLQLHRQLQSAQKEAAKDLVSFSPCGHFVLSIDMEESFFERLYQDQLLRAPSGVYKFVNSSKFQLGRATTASLLHLKSFGKDTALASFLLKEKTISCSLTAKTSKMAKDVIYKYAEISPEANIISTADVLVDFAKYFDSQTKCYFPVEIIQSPFDQDKRIALLIKPFLAELPKDNRLRAKECYMTVCRDNFLVTPPDQPLKSPKQIPSGAMKSDSSSDGEDGPNLIIDDIPDVEASDTFKSPQKAFNEILNRCYVVENTARDLNEMEILDEPASPEPSSPPSTPSRPPPSHSPVLSTPVVAIPSRLGELTYDRFWNLFKMGQQRLLISSCGVKLSPDSCIFKKDCPFFPKCTELWPNSCPDYKTVHLEVRPEYLQPWGCEVLSEEEIFSSLLGARLSSPAKPTILRLRVEASTGRIIFAEVQTVEQLLQSNPYSKFETRLARLMNVFSPLSRLPVGKYLLPSRSSFGGNKKKYQIYELITEKVKAYPKSAIDLHKSATEMFQAASKELISSTQATDLGATWRVVDRLPLDIYTPSGIDGENLLIPAIDTGFQMSSVPQTSQPLSEHPLIRRSPRKKAVPVEPEQTSPSVTPKKLKVESPAKNRVKELGGIETYWSTLHLFSPIAVQRQLRVRRTAAAEVSSLCPPERKRRIIGPLLVSGEFSFFTIGWMSEYDQAMRGPLKLKTEAKISKPKKHKKHRKENTKEVVTVEVVSAEKEPALTKTAAEIEFERKKERRMMETILSKAEKSHKQRIMEFNEQLNSMSEHFDIPKVSWTK